MAKDKLVKGDRIFPKIRESLEGKKIKQCKMVLCEDPETGKWYVKPEGPCKKGYMEKVRDAIIQRGLIFPNVMTGDLPESLRDKSKEDE